MAHKFLFIATTSASDFFFVLFFFYISWKETLLSFRFLVFTGNASFISGFSGLEFWVMLIKCKLQKHFELDKCF